MILIIQANGRRLSNPALDKIAADADVEVWDYLTLGTGPQGQSDFVDAHHNEFASRVHGAVLRIIDDMQAKK